MNTRLKVDTEPKKLLVTSEPYVIFEYGKYHPVIDVIDQKSKKSYYLYIEAKSMASKLEEFRIANDGNLLGVEFWVHKTSSERLAPYVVEE